MVVVILHANVVHAHRAGPAIIVLAVPEIHLGVGTARGIRMARSRLHDTAHLLHVVAEHLDGNLRVFRNLVRYEGLPAGHNHRRHHPDSPEVVGQLRAVQNRRPRHARIRRNRDTVTVRRHCKARLVRAQRERGHRNDIHVTVRHAHIVTVEPTAAVVRLVGTHAHGIELQETAHGSVYRADANERLLANEGHVVHRVVGVVINVLLDRLALYVDKVHRGKILRLAVKAEQSAL